MNNVLNRLVSDLNAAGTWFCEFSLIMLIQFSVLFFILLALDGILHKRCTAIFRYSLWLLILVKLVLPIQLSFPTSLAYWLAPLPHFLTVQPAAPISPAQEFTALSPPPVMNVPLPEFRQNLPSIPEQTHQPAATVPSVIPQNPVTPLTGRAILLIFWCAGVFVFSLLLIQRLWFVRRLMKQASDAPAEIQNLFEESLRQFNLKPSRLSVRLSPSLTSPAVCGILHPIVLLPDYLARSSSTQVLRTVIHHELIHVKRRDLHVNAIQTVLQVLYFYNPLLWCANAVIRRLREQAVDESLLAITRRSAAEYSDTLLRVARQAFAKPSLGLPFLGVVESKSALTRRIRHILSRPIPKKATLGLSGLAAILLLAAVLLPMARGENKTQAKEPKTEEGPEIKANSFIAALPNGITVEMIGVCEHFSEGRPWRRPDGTLLEERPYEQLGDSYSSISKRIIEVAFKTCAPDGQIGFALNRRPHGGLIHPLRNSMPAEDIWAGCVEVEKQSVRADIKLKVAAGPWKTISSSPPEGGSGSAGGNGDFSWGSSYQEKDRVAIPVTHTIDKYRQDYRIVAVDVNGEIHTSRGGSLNSSNSWTLITAKFKNLNKDQVKEFLFQTRPYEVVMFENVSLPPESEGKAQNAVGVVNLPDGRPAAQAEVILCTPTKKAEIREGRNNSKWDSLFVETDAKGWFSFPPQTEPYLLAVLHEKGYAEITQENLANSPNITLQSWARVEGTLRIGTKPGEYKKLAMFRHRPPEKGKPIPPRFEFGAETDSQGRFQIDWIPPGELSIGHWISLGHERSTTTHMGLYKVKPGETLHVTLGGAGRPVIGKIAVPPEYGKPDNWIRSDGMLRWSTRNVVPQPDNPDSMTAEEKRKWYEDWYASEEGKQFLEKLRFLEHSYPLVIDPDGTFRADDIPAGKYNLYINLFGESEKSPYGNGKTVATVQKLIEVPEIVEGRIDDPLDLGTLELKIKNQPNNDEEFPPAADVQTKLQDPSAEQREKTNSADVATPAARTLDFYVVSKETQQPLSNVPLSIRWGQSKKKEKTDEKGYFRVVLPDKKITYLSVEAEAPGRVPTKAEWRGDHTPPDIPLRYTLAVEAGTAIGGIIQDEAGSPIEGATVYLLVPSDREEDIERVSIHDYRVKTDGQGRWRCDILPKKLDDIWIRLSHPDFISDNMYGATEKPSMDQLRAMTGTMVMRKGLVLRGKVLDGEGIPIAGAAVAQGSDRWGSHYPKTKTDEQGQFAFENTKAGGVILTVQAQGFAPDLKEIQFDEKTEPVEFRLDEGRTIKGRIVDSGGNPVQGAFVSADTWRSHRSIEWRREKTDEQGRFEWNEAPADEVLFDMGKRDFMSVRKFGMKPSETEYVITMHVPLHVLGKVTDAQTGKAVENFDMIPGIDWGNSQPIYWNYRSEKSFSGGQYDYRFDEPQSGYLVRIEAEGYLPGISRKFKDDEGEVSFDFQLEKGKSVAGVVSFPDGTPVEKAEVILCTPAQGAYIQNGVNRQKQEIPSVETDPKGQFSLPAQIDPFLLAILHEKGYAEVTQEQLEQSANTTLQPWCRVEGTLRIGAQPGKNENIVVVIDSAYESMKPRPPYHDLKAKTDSEGRFQIDKVPSGEVKVGRNIFISERSSTYSHLCSYSVKPGETLRVAIGGTGRPVIGKINVPADYGKSINWIYRHSLLRLKLPEMPKPDNLDAMTPEEKQKWYKDWQESEEGKQFQKKQKSLSRFYAIQIESDGTFRADDVPAGTYILDVQAFEPPQKNMCGYGDVIGRVQNTIEIPEMAGGRSDEPLDVGVMELQIIKRLKLGETAPEIMFKTADGTGKKLSDFRGKYVLLDFWATWCGPCRGEMPNLKTLYEAHGKDSRLVMIGLSVDQKEEDWKKYLEQEKPGWVQGFLGDMKNSKEAADYGVDAIPAFFLIGPDGKLIDKGMRGTNIQTAVEKALLSL